MSDSKTTMPPDPSKFGRYWMQRYEMESEDAWEVWRWMPECQCWWVFNYSIEPDHAADQGWRCIAPAFTPTEVNCDGS